MTGTPEITPLDAIIGANVKRLRKAAEIGQEAMAEILECSVPFLSQLENGRRSWKTKWISACSDYFKVHPAELLGGANLSPEDQKTVDLIRALKDAETVRDKAKEELSSSKKKPKPKK